MLAGRRGGAAGRDIGAGRVASEDWSGRREDWPGAEVELLARAGAGRGAVAERHREDAGRGAVANSHREDDGRGAVAKSHREATAGGNANAAASGRDCWPGRCGRARPPVQNSKGGQCDKRTASISAQIAGERTASVLCADCRRRGLEFEGDFC